MHNNVIWRLNSVPMNFRCSSRGRSHLKYVLIDNNIKQNLLYHVSNTGWCESVFPVYNRKSKLLYFILLGFFFFSFRNLSIGNRYQKVEWIMIPAGCCNFLFWWVKFEDFWGITPFRNLENDKKKCMHNH